MPFILIKIDREKQNVEIIKNEKIKIQRENRYWESELILIENILKRRLILEFLYNQR